MTQKEILKRTDDYIVRLGMMHYVLGDEWKTLKAMKELWQNLTIDNDEMVQLLDDIDTIYFHCVHGVNKFEDCEKCEEILTKYKDNVHSK